jgi:hypothetical protein
LKSQQCSAVGLFHRDDLSDFRHGTKKRARNTRKQRTPDKKQMSANVASTAETASWDIKKSQATIRPMLITNVAAWIVDRLGKVIGEEHPKLINERFDREVPSSNWVFSLAKGILRLRLTNARLRSE